MLLGNGGVLGIDIGSSSIKIVELGQVGNTYELRNLGEALLPQNSILNKSVANSESITQTLSTLIDDIGIQADDAAISISGSSVMMKRISLPKMSNAELKKSIIWELENSIPGGINEVNYDYQIIPGDNPKDNIDVLVIAANKKATKDYVSIVTQVGLNPVIVDLDVFSLDSMYEVNYPDSEGLLALVNIGAVVTNLIIIKDGGPVFAQDLEIGGDRYTNMIMAEMELSYEEAEEVKYNQRTGLVDPALNQLAHNFIDILCADIKKALDSFSLAHTEEKVKRIMIGGGPSGMPGIQEALSVLTQSYVGVLNPFRKIEYNNNNFDSEYIEEISSKMTIATGLALRIP